MVNLRNLIIKFNLNKLVVPGFLSFTKPVPNFSSYVADKIGNIYNRNHGKILKPYMKNGYLTVDLYKNKKMYHKKIHRLMLETFVGPCPRGMESCHNNGIKTDNRPENLRWDTHKNNCMDRKRGYTISIT